jgi:hypothetical protein
MWQSGQQTADTFLRVTKPVHGGSVDPIDAQFYRVAHSGN